MITLETITAPNLTDADIEQLLVVCNGAFPDPKRDANGFIGWMKNSWQLPDAKPEERRRKIVARNGDGHIMASADVWGRTIQTTRGKLTIAALAGVMSHPSVRGAGYGRAVVKAVFDLVDAGEFAFSFFQTGAAREFYLKLGCRVVPNIIYNSLDAEKPRAYPFWEPHAMIYPATGNWPAGEIDILGRGW